MALRFTRSATQSTTLPWLFVLPAVLLVTVVSAVPISTAIYLSFHSTNYLKAGSFIGLDHYLSAFEDPGFLANLRSTAIFVVGSALLTIPLGTVGAILLNQPIRFNVAFRTILLLPWMISQLVTALIWGWMVNEIYGPMNYLISLLGGGPISFLSDPNYAMATLIVANAWHAYGFVLVLVLATLKTIPTELYESAEIDGAGSLSAFRYITLPFLKPTIAVACILQMLYDVNMVVLPMVVTAGGPFLATEFVGLRIYKEAFQNWNLGFASTLSILLFLTNMVFGAVYIRLLYRSNPGNE